MTIIEYYNGCVDEFTDDCIHLFAYDIHAEEVDYVYSTVCGEKEMKRNSRHESHRGTSLPTSRFTSVSATNSAVYDTVNTATIQTSKFCYTTLVFQCMLTKLSKILAPKINYDCEVAHFCL